MCLSTGNIKDAYYCCSSTNDVSERLFSRTITGQSARRHNRFCVSLFKVINLDLGVHTVSPPHSAPLLDLPSNPITALCGHVFDVG